jgi:hypothetical protein
MINYKNMDLWPELRRPLFVAASVLYESLQPSALPFAYPSNLSFGGPISLTNHAYLVLALQRRLSGAGAAFVL